MIFNFKIISFIRIHLSFMCLCFLTVLFCYNSQAQETNEEVKRLQRGIFIFNFAQQVSWPNLDEESSFKIGVLGPDHTVIDLQAMAQKRKIHNKPVQVVRFNSIRQIKDVQLLYVNNKYNYTIGYILNKISKKNVLLVTEDYNYNASMINMVAVGNSFEYEISLDRIQGEGFAVAPSLKRYAISSSQKWKRLYKKTEKSLNEVQEKTEEQENIIKNKEEVIEYQNRKITNQEKEIGTKDQEITERKNKIINLYTESQIQQKKYKEKEQIELELEKSIKEQITFIKNQEAKIEKSNQEIQKQQDFLKEQSKQIKQQDEILTRQNVRLSTQKKINSLLIALISLILLGSFFIYKGYLAKKKFNIELEKKNQAIYEQSLALEAKNKELEQFAYIASHDLQEPLNTISSFIGLIVEDYGDRIDSVGKESLNFIQDASLRMKNLIDALLEYSRLGRGKEYAKVDTNNVLADLKADLKSVIDKEGAKITIGKLPTVTGSEIELRLLFQNLISNAIKFRADGVVPEIKISCSKKNKSKNQQNDFWQFAIKDNGIGIPEEHKERIFAIFQRLHSREQYQGTGIGLAHCKKIVESHGGEIWLTSKVGEGSTFYFTIPLSSSQ